MTYLADLGVSHSAISIMGARWDYGLLRSPENGLLVLIMCRQVSIFGHFGNHELPVMFLLVSVVLFRHANVSRCILQQEHCWRRKSATHQCGQRPNQTILKNEQNQNNKTNCKGKRHAVTGDIRLFSIVDFADMNKYTCLENRHTDRARSLSNMFSGVPFLFFWTKILICLLRNFV